MKVIHYFVIKLKNDRWEIASSLEPEKDHIVNLIKEKNRQKPNVVMVLAACELEVSP